MEGIDDLFRIHVYQYDRKLDHFVQVGPRVLFASTFEVQHTNYLRGGSNWWWWGWRRSWSLPLFASLASSGLDARQSGAFRGECYCRRGEEGEAHVFPYGFTVLAARYSIARVPCLRAVAYKLITCCLLLQCLRAVCCSACFLSPLALRAHTLPLLNCSTRQITCLRAAVTCNSAGLRCCGGCQNQCLLVCLTDR